MQSLPRYNVNHPQDQLLDQDPNTLKKFHMEIIWVNSSFKEKNKKGKKILATEVAGALLIVAFSSLVCQTTMIDKDYNLEYSLVSFNFLYT